jgi:hypothetical protein
VAGPRPVQSVRLVLYCTVKLPVRLLVRPRVTFDPPKAATLVVAIHISANGQAAPLKNVLFLLVGALLANLLGIRRYCKRPLAGSQPIRRYAAGTKVVPLHSAWLKTPEERTNIQERGVFPKKGNVYVVRTAKVMPDGKVALQLIGVTASRDARPSRFGRRKASARWQNCSRKFEHYNSVDREVRVGYQCRRIIFAAKGYWRRGMIS